MKRERNSILTKYRFLLKSFGPQGWWPTTPPGRIRPRYEPRRSTARRSQKEMLEICVGAILTQNTSWNNVEKVLVGLNQNRLMSLKPLLSLSPSKMESHLRSSGYFRQKARSLRSFLQFAQKIYHGQFRLLFAGPLREVRRTLLSLHGIGPETADSMLLYAAGRAVFVVDAYTRRIGMRWGMIRGNESYDQIQDLLVRSLPRTARLYGELHALLVKLGKKFCRTKPLCSPCPLRSVCPTGVRDVSVSLSLIHLH